MDVFSSITKRKKETFMQSKSIGILGGAGPLAGVYLTERVLSLAATLYGCYRDADFPKVFFINFPFSEMLTGQIDEIQIRKEVSGCLELLRKSGACVLSIACNTLHAFLDKEEDFENLVHLPKEVFQEIPPFEVPLVLCTSTSAICALHQKFFPCMYPDAQTQKKVDEIIDRALKGEERKAIAQELLQLIDAQTASTVVLGCTELSLLYKDLSTCTKFLIDPLEIAAKKVLQKYFN